MLVVVPVVLQLAISAASETDVALKVPAAREFVAMFLLGARVGLAPGHGRFGDHDAETLAASLTVPPHALDCIGVGAAACDFELLLSYGVGDALHETLMPAQRFDRDGGVELLAELKLITVLVALQERELFFGCD